MTGAGILPVSMHHGVLYFLFGRENQYNDTPGWSDFGGGVEKGEHYKETMLREVEEETCGFISKDEILISIKKNGFVPLHINNNGRNYYTHIVPVHYDEKLPVYFNRVHEFINKKHPNIIKESVIFEKDKLKWVSLEELKTIDFRPFYIGIIKKIFKNQDKIRGLFSERIFHTRKHRHRPKHLQMYM